MGTEAAVAGTAQEEAEAEVAGPQVAAAAAEVADGTDGAYTSNTQTDKAGTQLT